MKRIIYLLLFLLFAMFSFVLHLKNPGVVPFSFPFINLEAPLGLLLLVALLFGVLIGAALMSVSLMRSNWSKNKTKRQLAKVEQEVENLRTMPIKDDL